MINTTIPALTTIAKQVEPGYLQQLSENYIIYKRQAHCCMHITESEHNYSYSFQQCVDNKIYINDTAYTEPMLLEPKGYQAITMPEIANLKQEFFTAFLEKYPLTEQIYLGTGHEHQMPSAELIQALHEKNIAVEALKNNLLPAIHMILMEEDRNFLMFIHV